MMETVVTTGVTRRAKLQSNCYCQQTNTQLSTGRMSFLLPNQQCRSTEGCADLAGGGDMTGARCKLLHVSEFQLVTATILIIT